MSFDLAERILVQCIRTATLPMQGPLPEVAADASIWPAVRRAAEKHGLLPLLYSALKAQGKLAGLPPGMASELRLDYQRASLTVWQAYRELVPLLERLEAEGIPVILLKGIALAATLYDDAALRPLSDADILVSAEDMPRACAMLLESGYTTSATTLDGLDGGPLAERSFVRHGTHPAKVDLHYHVTMFPYYAQHMPISWFWQRTATACIIGRPVSILAPEAQLMHLSLHFTHHGGERLLWSYDFALLLARHGQDMDWQAISQAATAFGLVQDVHQALAQVREVWGQAIPAEAKAFLGELAPRFVERLAFKANRSPIWGLHVVWYGLSMSSLRGRIAFWRRALFPDAAYMREHYRISHSCLLPAYYLWRAGNSVGRILRSVFLLIRA